MEHNIFELTNPQKSIWYMEQYFKGTAINNICGSLTINEIVDFEIFKKSINLFVKSNESFHIRLFMENSIPKQYFCDFEEFDLEIIDIKSNDEILDIEKDMVNIPFNMIESPLFKFKLFRLPNGHGGFVVNTHHIISDAATIAIIGSSIARIYTNLKNNIEIDTNIPSYVDYIISEQEYLLSDKFKKDEKYWNEQFETIPDIASIPASFRDTINYSSNSKRELFILPKDIVDKIRQLCSKEKISVFNFFMAIYSLYIGRVSNLDEFVIGTPILNRTNFKEKHTSGMFISTVPLKITIDNNSSFLDFVSNIAMDSMSMLRHQRYPYQYLLENLRNKYGSVPNLYDNLISYQVTKTIDKTIALPYSVHWVEANEISCGINIHIHDNDDSGNLTMCYDYLVDKYSSEDIIATHNRILHIVNQLLNNINISMKDIEIVTPEEKNKILYEFNNTKVNYPKDKTIVDLFEEQVKINPNKVALVSNKIKLTYKELNELSNKLAYELINNGIKNNSNVAIMVNRSPEMIIGLLAILKCGATYIPIDPEYPEDRICYMLDNSKTQVLLVNNASINLHDYKYAKIDISLSNLKNLDYPINNPDTEINLDNTMYIIYTSGTTGNPKGVMVSYNNVYNFILGIKNVINFSDDEVMLSLTTICFDIFGLEVWCSLTLGMTLVLANEKEQNITSLLNTLCIENNVNIMQTTPSRYLKLIEDEKNLAFLNNVTDILVGGEPLPIKLLNYFHNNTKANIFNMYGPTETTIWSTTKDLTTSDSITIGNPILNTNCYILDDNLQLLPCNVPGTLYIGGLGVSKGYYNNSLLTSEKFIHSPFINNELIYNTNDLAYWNENGEIVHLGRNDFQIKLNGYRIELAEIEKTISSFNGVEKSAVICNESEKKLYAFYTSKENIDIKNLKSFLLKKLPTYMIPYKFIKLDSFPFTPNGKLDRKALKIPNETSITNTEFVRPSSITDNKLYNLVKDIIKIDSFSMSNDIFSLGMDSINILNLSIKIEDTFNKKISPQQIINCSTLLDLSKLIDSYVADNRILIPPLPTEYNLSYPTSSAQKRIYYSSQLAGKNSIVYNLPGGIILDKTPDIDKLEKCFNKLIDRHESLRTYFELENGEVVQKIVEKIEFKLDVSSANYKDIPSCFKGFAKPFNLNIAPLFRAKLIKFENDKCLLLFDMHHIISDGTSLQILIKDLCALYNNDNLEKINLTYKDFAVWENENINTEVFENSKNYWISQFNNDIPVLDIPTNYPRPSKKSFEGAKIYKTLEKDLTNNIYEMCKKLNVTPYMLLLSAYYILLSKYSRQDDIVVGSPIIGRNNSQLSNIIGMFVNTLPLCTKIDDNICIKEFINNIKNMCLNAFKHQSYPLDEIVNNLNISRDVSRNPLFDTLFTYQNGGLETFDLGNIKSKYYISDTNISKFDLSLEIVPNDDVLNLNFEYCTHLFTKDFVENISEHYINIVKIILNNPEIKLSNIDMLFTEERNRIVNDFNDNYLDYPKNCNLLDLFKNIVSLYPNNIAVQYGEKSITYKELDEKSNTLAIQIINSGIKKGDIVGVCINKSIELLISVWAILKSGAVYMPIYVGYPKDRIEYMLENSNCKLLIVNTTMKNVLNAKCKIIDIKGFEHIINTVDFKISEEILPHDLAYIIYTSGSTGKPKGVKIMHKNLINYIFSFNKLFGNISPEDKLLSSTNISFDVSIWELFLSILNGSTLVLYSEEIINNIFEYTRNIIDYGITMLYIPPNILEEVYTILKNSENIKINKLLVGVEPIKKSTLNKYYDLNPNLTIVNGYGPTETTICSTALVYKKDEKNDDIVSIGKPLSNTNIYIVDKNMNIMPIDVPGELCISGDGVGDGYINNKIENNDHFINNIFDSSSRLYKTGDIAKWNSDGTIKYITRKDNQVKFSGYRIELKEIDYAIMQYPSVTKCLTIIYTNGKKSYLTTYFTADKQINTSDLSSYLQTKLAFYMIPSIYMQLENFPITVNGKIDKNSLPKPKIKSTQAYVSPSTDLQKTLCSIWQELFGIKKVGINDNFFDLGGDSLSAIKFQVEALNRNLNISYADIFSNPTIKLLSEKSTSQVINKGIEEEYDYSKINNLLLFNDIKNIPKNIKQHEINSILLTGSTGFLGSHILDNYLSTNPKGVVYCFVRRKDLGNPEERLKKTLEFYFGNKYDKIFGKNIKVITADITLENFGLNSIDYEDLAKKIDIVINSAALVKHYGDYEQFNDINVLGTKRLINFCKKYNKKLYHISTASVSGMGLPENNIEKNEQVTYFSERDLYKNQNLNNTYIRTKFEAEKLILENINLGLDACIFRMGNISNRYSDSKFQINVSENAFVNRIKSILKLGVIQEGFKNHATEFAPVDICAKAIINIINTNPNFTVFHIFNNNLISFIDIIKYLNDLGIDLKFVPDEEFSATVNKFLKNSKLKNEISGIITDLNSNKLFTLNANILLDCDFTVSYLNTINFKWPKINKKYITNYIEYFRKIKYFN